MEKLNGLLIYNKEEKAINIAFINMLIKAGESRDIRLRYVDREDAIHRLMDCDFIINRTRDYKVAEKFEHRGIPSFNSSYINRIGNDKYLTYKEIETLGIAFMPLVEETDFPYVLKSRSGHGGTEVFMVKNRSDFMAARETLKEKSFICQKIADTPGKDLRVYVMGGKIVKALLRDGLGDFRSNYGLHGKAEIYNLNRKEEQLVLRILDFLKPDYAGIDFLFNNERLVFNEIEDVVGARMLYEISDINIADMYMEYIGRKIREKTN